MQDLQGEKSRIEKSLHAFHDTEAGASKMGDSTTQGGSSSLEMQQTLQRLQQQLADAERTIQELQNKQTDGTSSARQQQPPRPTLQQQQRPPMSPSDLSDRIDRRQKNVRKQWNELTQGWDMVPDTTTNTTPSSSKGGGLQENKQAPVPDDTNSWFSKSLTSDPKSSNAAATTTSPPSSISSVGKNRFGSSDLDGPMRSQQGRDKKKPPESSSGEWWGIENEAGRRRPGNPDGSYRNDGGNFMSSSS
eukprot:scaffold4408_cov130-Cylindrotheca_fusiformis.AAC.1